MGSRPIFVNIDVGKPTRNSSTLVVAPVITPLALVGLDGGFFS